MSTVTLYRPVGAEELALIEDSGFTAFPPRLPEQPIFYPVTNESCAIQIARDWDAKRNPSHKGFVRQFAVDADFLSGFQKKVVGGREHEEYWIPAHDLESFNSNIVGQIEVTHSVDGTDQGENENA